MKIKITAPYFREPFQEGSEHEAAPTEFDDAVVYRIVADGSSLYLVDGEFEVLS